MTAPQRSLLVLPSYAAWTEAERAALGLLEGAIVRLAKATAGRSDGGLFGEMPSAECAATLQHPLSRHFPHPHDANLQRSEAEWTVLTRYHHAIAGLVTGQPIGRVVQAIAQHVAGSGDFRRTRAQTAADSAGRYFRYPASDQIPRRMEELGEVLASPADRPDAFDAVMTLVAVSNLHPFRDGNGRVARVLFNGLLQRRQANPSCYLPLHPLALLSRGGFVVRIRLAEIRGEWLPLIQFLNAATRLWGANLQNSRRAAVRPDLTAGRLESALREAARGR